MIKKLFAFGFANTHTETLQITNLVILRGLKTAAKNLKKLQIQDSRHTFNPDNAPHSVYE